MKKKRKILLEKIKQDKERLEEELKDFLVGLPEKKGYEAYVDLFHVLKDWKTTKMPMEMDFTIITNFGTSLCEMLDSDRKISVGLALLFAFINNRISDESKNKKLKDLPDNLTKEITDFELLLKRFLFL